MAQRRDVTLPTLLLTSLTVYGFLLVWAQNDPIELTTSTGDQGSPMSPAGFNIVTGGNVSIELAPGHSTRIVPAVTTPAPDPTDHMDSTPTATTRLSAATTPLPTAATGEGAARGPPDVPPAITHTPGISPGTTGNANIIPRSPKRSRAATNSTGRISIKVKIQSSAPQDEAMEKFLLKICELFRTLQLDDVLMTLGPERTPMVCLPSKKN